MTEKFEPQGYRDELAESLKVKRALGEDGRELAKEQLELEKDTIEYKRADIQHAEDNLAKKSEKGEEGKESIESSKLEWGPELGQMSWYNAQAEIEELNKSLNKGLIKSEEPWRLPTEDELLAEFNKAGKTPAGFERDCYWSGTTHPGLPGSAYFINMGRGNVDIDYKRNPNFLARCVR